MVPKKKERKRKKWFKRLNRYVFQFRSIAKCILFVLAHAAMDILFEVE